MFMLSAQGFESSKQIAMVPDESVLWNVRPMPEQQGVLYSNPNASPDTISDTVNIAIRDVQHMPPIKPLGYGRYGTVSRKGGTAFKAIHAYGEEFSLNADEHDSYVGLSAVRASVMLHTGLTKIAQPDAAIQYAAPEMLACFVSSDLEGRASRTTWAMSYEEGNQPKLWHRGIPDVWTQRAQYNEAIKACGGDPESVNLDTTSGNLLVVAGLSCAVKRLVKLDVSAHSPYKW